MRHRVGNASPTGPNTVFTILLAPEIQRELVTPYLENLNFPVVIQQRDPVEMVSVVDAVLCKSGTSTLVVGLAGKPMVIIYKVGKISAFIGSILVNVKFFGLVNLLMNKEIVPELFQTEASVDNIVERFEEILSNPEYREKMISDLNELPSVLGGGGANVRVANKVGEFLESI